MGKKAGVTTKRNNMKDVVAEVAVATGLSSLVLKVSNCIILCSVTGISDFCSSQSLRREIVLVRPTL